MMKNDSVHPIASTNLDDEKEVDLKTALKNHHRRGDHHGCGDHHDDATVSWLINELSLRNLNDIDVVERIFRTGLSDMLIEELKKAALPGTGGAPDDWAEACVKMELINDFKELVDSLLNEGGLKINDKVFSLHAFSRSLFFERELKFVEYCPILNTLWDLLFDEAPTIEQIKDLLQTLVLISGLGLGASSGLFGVDFGEMQEALKRHSDPEDVSWSFCSKEVESRYVVPSSDRCSAIFNAGVLDSQWTHGHFNPSVNSTNNYASVDNSYGAAWALTLIDSYPLYSVLSIYSLALSCIFSVGCYLFITTTSFSLTSKRSDGTAGDECAHLVQAWWVFVRWIVLVSFVLWVLGTLATGYAYGTLAYVKFPNFAVETDRYFWKKPALISTGIGSVANYGMVALALVIGLWSMFSLGLANKCRIKNFLVNRRDSVRRRILSKKSSYPKSALSVAP